MAALFLRRQRGPGGDSARAGCGANHRTSGAAESYTGRSSACASRARADGRGPHSRAASSHISTRARADGRGPHSRAASSHISTRARDSRAYAGVRGPDSRACGSYASTCARDSRARAAHPHTSRRSTHGRAGRAVHNRGDPEFHPPPGGNRRGYQGDLDQQGRDKPH